MSVIGTDIYELSETVDIRSPKWAPPKRIAASDARKHAPPLAAKPLLLSLNPRNSPGAASLNALTKRSLTGLPHSMCLLGADTENGPPFYFLNFNADFRLMANIYQSLLITALRCHFVSVGKIKLLLFLWCSLIFSGCTPNFFYQCHQLKKCFSSPEWVVKMYMPKTSITLMFVSLCLLSCLVEFKQVFLPQCL